MQALKALVIFLGMVIVFGMTVLAWGIYKKSQDPGFRMFDLGDEPPAALGISATPGTAEVPAPFGSLPLRLERGCAIEAMAPAGALLHLRIGPAGGPCEKVVVVDVGRGRILGDVRVER